MEFLLIVIGILGLGALVIALYVFTVAARRYVSDTGHKDPAYSSDLSPYRDWVTRSREERRRSDEDVDFPIIIDGQRIDRNRRRLPDRRGNRRMWVKRSDCDRRRNTETPAFPLTINGETIPEDRRKNPDRRRSD